MIEARGLSKRYGDKLAVDDRIQAVVYAYETGLIAPQSRR
jgi:hypothetical protein